MSFPLAFHLTWTTHGTWLPGDARGWVDKTKHGIQSPDAERRQWAFEKIGTPPVALNEKQRQIAKETICTHCDIRHWPLHAIYVGGAHVHVVVTGDESPERIMSQFKAWTSRRLNEARNEGKHKWWTEGGSTKWINDERYLREAILYVSERQ